MAVQQLSEPPAGPKKAYSFLEFPRALHEMSLLLPADRYLKRLGGGRGKPVMVLPGFAADDRTTAITRKYLNHWGFDARPWGIGQNLNPRNISDTASAVEQVGHNIDKLATQLSALKAQTGQKVTLLGWSLGGIVSRQLAAKYPDLVSSVTTMGTPFGDFRSTSVYPLMQLLNKYEVSQNDLDLWDEMANVAIGDIPLTVIYSKSDGFVPPHNARAARSKVIEFIEVVCSHVGFAVNPVVLKLLANRLREDSLNWRPFQPSLLERALYRTS